VHHILLLSPLLFLFSHFSRSLMSLSLICFLFVYLLPRSSLLFSCHFLSLSLSLSLLFSLSIYFYLSIYLSIYHFYIAICLSISQYTYCSSNKIEREGEEYIQKTYTCTHFSSLLYLSYVCVYNNRQQDIHTYTLSIEKTKKDINTDAEQKIREKKLSQNVL